MSDTGFTISITKEQLATLPIEEFDGQITVVETLPAVSEALKEIRHAGTVGFDTETKPSFRKGQLNKVSLMQVSTADHCYLFRINKTGLCPEIVSFLEDPGVKKVGLSLKDDFLVLHRLAQFEPAGFIDLQETVREFTITDASLQKIYAIIFNRRISKSQRLSNWEAPVLTVSQQSYASIDAWACLRIHSALTSHRFNPDLSPYKLTVKPESEEETPA